ncbi:MAG: hypothetical protein BIFFINMI_03499 [Phycisphaerae bacterium]|nr:hypothetical protein [Phycisphaerae bacterium]
MKSAGRLAGALLSAVLIAWASPAEADQGAAGGHGRWAGAARDTAKAGVGQTQKAAGALNQGVGDCVKAWTHQGIRGTALADRIHKLHAAKRFARRNHRGGLGQGNFQHPRGKGFGQGGPHGQSNDGDKAPGVDKDKGTPRTQTGSGGVGGRFGHRSGGQRPAGSGAPSGGNTPL